jgi:IPT/TIG domain
MKLTFGVFIIIVIFQIGCSKKDNPNIAKSVSIYSITPSSGSANTIVVIKGADFGPDITDNLVKFNNDSAVVLSASDDSLVVVAPAHGTSGPVTVTVDGSTATGPTFTYIIDSVDVYAAGSAQGIEYWKNGEVTFLGPTQSNFGGAYGLAISGTDLYVAGYSYFTAAFWKNGQKTILSEPDSIALAKALVIDGNDVYVGGSDNNAPVYWKNGIKNRLGGYGRVNALAVNGNDVYAAGYGGGFNLVYWKNGIITILGSRSPIEGGATSIALSGPDVYISGTDSGDAIYWKNGVRVILAKFSGQDVAQANAIAVSGNSVYVAGYYSGDAVYWKDGVQIMLPKLSYAAARATAITLYQSDIYIGGEDGETPVYWKNGVENVLCCSELGPVNAIVVTKH